MPSIPNILGRIRSFFRSESKLGESLHVARAIGVIEHRRNGVLLHREVVLNVKTKAGIDFTFAQTYSTGPGGAGLTYIALSDDTLTETVDSTTLSNEITGNGLLRSLGTYNHVAGTSTCTVSKMFTCITNPQAAQKAALFTVTGPPPAGTMHHVLAFSERSLLVNDTLTVTFTITIT